MVLYQIVTVKINLITQLKYNLDGKNHHLHRYVWEQANGPIPKNMVIHHKDFNRGNWSLDNLEMLTRAEHIKCHKINRWNSADMITSVLERSNNANI